MSLSTELFLAWRYFKPKRSAVSIITLISVIGVALGVSVLIVVIAIMTGFSDHLKNKLLETGAHGQIQKALSASARHPDGAAQRITEPESASIISMLKEKGAADAVPVIKSPILLQVGESFEPKLLLAFDPSRETKFFPVRNAVEKARQAEIRSYHFPRRIGKFSLGPKEVLISSVMSDEFKLQAGDKLILHTPNRLMSMVKRGADGRYEIDPAAEKYLPAEFTVSGIYTFEKYDFDKNVIFMGLDEADDLFGLDWGDSTHIFLWMNDPFHMTGFNKSVMDELQTWRYGNNLRYFSWEVMHRQILDVLAVEKNMMFFLLIFIVLVAAFSITNTLITTVIQKTREIGLLKSMGVGSGAVMRIFVLQGAFVGLLGSAFGVLLGWLIVVYRMNILELLRIISGTEIFPKQLYLVNELPAHIVWSDVAVIVMISIVLCTCGALIPAIRAAKLDPARALRYE